MSNHSFQIKNVLDLIDKEVLRNFLLGYNHVTVSGISVYFKTCSGDPAGPRDIDCVNPTSDPDNTFENYRPYCRFYRKDCGQDQKCIRFDRRVVMDYYADPNKAPMLYRCHRNIWDMAYPLVIENQLMGVIFSGQITVRKTQEGVLWSDELKQSYSYVSWDYADSNETHCDQLEDQIAVIENDGDLTDFQKKKLACILADAQNDEKTAPVSELDRRFQDFLNFGKITAGLLSEQYKCWKVATEFKEQNRQIYFQKECVMQLSEEDRLNIRDWQVSLMNSLSAIARHFKIERAGVFHGKVIPEGSVNQEIAFELVAMDTPLWWRSARSFSWDPKEYPKSGEVYPPGKSPKQIAKVVGENLSRDKYFYVFPYASEATINVYTLIVLQNNRQLSEFTKGYLKDLLLQICRQDETIRLNLRAEETHEAFTQHVVEVRHDLKTNLQLIMNSVQKYARLLRTGTPPDSQTSRDQSVLVRQAVDTHSLAVTRLNWEIQPKKAKKLEPFNVLSAIKQQVLQFKGVASDRKITLLVLEDTKAKDSLLLFDDSLFDRGLQVLLDNAIKYSYDSREINIECKTRGKKFIFSMQNYGIGIPPDLLKDVTKRTHRAKVIDKGEERVGKKAKERKGEGLGLYIANEIFTKQLKGTLEITSRKAPGVHEETEAYHRYLTTVKVTIPVGIQE